VNLGLWGYGYKWMQKNLKIDDTIVKSNFVPGDGGQLLSIFPELDMVIVFTAGNYGVDPKSVYYNLINKYILPAVWSSS